MSLYSRIRHLWELSEYEPGTPTDEYKTPGTEVSMIVKKPKKKQEARFIPYQKQTPAQEIANQQP